MTMNKTLIMCLLAAPLAIGMGCSDDTGSTDTEDATETGDGDGDPATDTDTQGDGDGDPTQGDGDGDTGDGDGDTGDGDGDTGDGDGDPPPPPPVTYPDNAPEEYNRVDRAGMPAVNTAVITSKDDYNAANPVDDVMVNNPFIPEIVANVTGFHAALDDDLIGLDLIPCTVPDECIVAQAGPLVIPDTLKINYEFPATFPNGRALADPVIDITLAVLLLDLGIPGQDAGLFAGLPLNPPANDVPFLDGFPYLADPN